MLPAARRATARFGRGHQRWRQCARPRQVRGVDPVHSPRAGQRGQPDPGVLPDHGGRRGVAYRRRGAAAPESDGSRAGIHGHLSVAAAWPAAPPRHPVRVAREVSSPPGERVVVVAAHPAFRRADREAEAAPAGGRQAPSLHHPGDADERCGAQRRGARARRASSTRVGRLRKSGRLAQSIAEPAAQRVVAGSAGTDRSRPGASGRDRRKRRRSTSCI